MAPPRKPWVELLLARSVLYWAGCRMRSDPTPLNRADVHLAQARYQVAVAGVGGRAAMEATFAKEEKRCDLPLRRT